MFYKLKRDYMLRGWKLLPTGVIKRETRQFNFLNGKKYSVLKRCTGFLDSESTSFDDEERKILEELRAEGYVEINDIPSPLEDGQAYKFYDNRFLHSIHWSITGRCNCSCRHCYMSAPQHKVEEFTHTQCMDIIEQMAACGIQTVSLTGGEALIRKDFWEIVDALTDADIKITTIFSNGLLINEKFFAELEQRNLRPDFQLSFDGVGGCHDWLRGVDGAEKFTMRALKLICENNLEVTCAFGIYKRNAPVLRETVKKLASLGVKHLRVAPIFITGEAFDMRDKILTTEEMYDFFLEYIPQYIADGAPMPLNLTGLFAGIDAKNYRIPYVKMPEDVQSDKFCLCGQIRNSMTISFDGTMIPCEMMGFDDSGKKYFSRVTEKSLKALLNDKTHMNFINTRLKDYFAANSLCAACKYRNRCAGGCRGMAMSENHDGNLLGVDKVTCTFFKGGYYDKVLEIAKKLNLNQVGA